MVIPLNMGIITKQPFKLDLFISKKFRFLIYQASYKRYLDAFLFGNVLSFFNLNMANMKLNFHDIFVN